MHSKTFQKPEEIFQWNYFIFLTHAFRDHKLFQERQENIAGCIPSWKEEGVGTAVMKEKDSLHPYVMGKCRKSKPITNKPLGFFRSSILLDKRTMFQLTTHTKEVCKSKGMYYPNWLLQFLPAA